ncbi:redoxin domain-containing protein [Amphibacillus sp. Q70]|uniref:redoxin domain-containing protein n=1 Tax=Amphibacillus sp. Q70 TaxID=3453416 RepID=UPI003F8304E1
MRKAVMAIILLVMFGWAIYEFVFQSDDLQKDQEVVEEVDKEEVENEELSEESGQESSQIENTVGLEIGNIAPDFRLTTLNGEETALSDYRGSRVMINFWATWCPPCRAEMPDMEEFYQNTDIEILAVNLTETESDINQIQQFVDEYDLTFPILLDEVIEVAAIYAIQPIPTSFMIDSEGIIQFKTFGPLTYEQMIQVLETMD